MTRATSRTRSARKVPRPRVEPLEGRLTPVNIAGTAAADTFVVRLDAAGTNLEVVENNAVVFTAALAGAPNVTIDAGAGADQLTVDFVNGNPVPAAGLTFNGDTEADSLILLNTTLAADWQVTAADAGTVTAGGRVTTFTGTEDLTGGGGADTFTFQAAGSVGGNVNGQGGADRLDFSALGSQDVTVTALGGTDGFNLSTPGAVPIGGVVFNMNGVTGSAAGATDRLTGRDANATWQLGVGAGNTFYRDAATGRLLTFANVEDLVGGSATDTYSLNDGLAHTVTLTGPGAVDGFDGQTDNIPGTFQNFNRVDGNLAPARTTLQGLDQDAQWNVQAGDDQYVTGGRTLGFVRVTDLSGGTGDDGFNFLAGGAIAGNVDGRGGVDTLSFAAVASQDVFLTGLGAVDGFDGFPIALVPIGGVFFNVNAVTGSAAGTTDRLRGLNTASTWVVRAGAGQTSYQDDASGRALTFTNVDQLSGGTQADQFFVDFGFGPPVPGTGLTVNGGAGTDLLVAAGTFGADFFTLSPTALRVNGRDVRYALVEDLEAQGGAGNDTFTSLAAALPGAVRQVRFFGQDGNDTAVVSPASTAPLFLDGGAGFDTLKVQRLGALLVPPGPPRGAVDGTYLFRNRQRIDFLSFESQGIAGVSQYQGQG